MTITSRALREQIAAGAAGAPPGFVGTAQALRTLFSQVLYARMSGATGKILVDAATLAPFTNSSAPKYAYNGINSSTIIRAEEGFLQGAQLGVPFAYDAGLGSANGSLIAGLVADVRDSGFNLPSKVNGIEGIDLSLCSTVMVDWTPPSIVNSDLMAPGSASTETGWGFYQRTNLGGRLRFELYTAPGRPLISASPGGSVVAGEFHQAAMVRTGVGDYKTYLYRNWSLISSGARTGYPDVMPGFNNNIYGSNIRFAASGGPSVSRVRGWTSPLSSTEIADIIAGTGSPPDPSNDLIGLRSGAYIPTSLLVLPIESGASGNVTSEF